jgi:hypothetical protein
VPKLLNTGSIGMGAIGLDEPRWVRDERGRIG